MALEKVILYFDGYCVLCNWWVRLLCKIDKKNIFFFSALEYMSETEKNRFNLENPKTDSIIVWDHKSPPKVEAEAIFYIIKRIGGLWSIFLIFKLVPLQLLNKLYRLIARNRKKWFGSYTECPLPEKKIKNRFLSHQQAGNKNDL